MKISTISRWVASASLLLTLHGSAIAQDDEKKFCWKTTYGRGVGTVPTNCAAGQDKDAGLCYQACPTGMKGVGPVCWSACPAGFRDDGGFCAKPAPYGRGTGYAAWDEGKCRAESASKNCEKNGLMWYPTCAANFHAVGCCICSPDCPAGMADIGVSCTKTTSTRGVGQIPSCGSGLAADAGLCYPSCSRDYDGVGPVCWGKCTGEFPFACGAGCAKSQAACAAAVTSMVTETVSFAANVLTMALGAPGVTSAAKAGMSAGLKAAAKTTAKSATKALPTIAGDMAKSYARDFGKTFVKSYVKGQLDPKNLFNNAYKSAKFAGLTGANAAAKEFGDMKRDGQFDWSMLTAADPTGAAAMVYAFAQYGSCTVEDLAPDVNKLQFGAISGTGSEVKTIEITAQNTTTITDITTSAHNGCQIVPESTCAGKTLQPGQKCSINVRVKGQGALDGEVRVYTTVYDAIPMAFGVTANDAAAAKCPLTGDDESVNLSSIAGVWAWNNDQNNKVIIRHDGTVDSNVGKGKVEVTDPIKRIYKITIGASVGTLALANDHERITINGSFPGTKRPWDDRCNPGETFFAGLCYDVPVGFAPTAPGFIGKPCPGDWRDDGTQCYPPWKGVKVNYQADADGTFTMRHPILVTDCGSYAATKNQACPANFKNTGGPAGCTCEAQPTSKQVRSLIGKPSK